MLNKDDPRLTAYALGELQDDETLAREIADNPELQAEVDAIRACAAGLTAAFKAEPLPVVARAEKNAGKGRRYAFRFFAAAAAAVVVVIGLVGVVTSDNPKILAQRSIEAGIESVEVEDADFKTSDTVDFAEAGEINEVVSLESVSAVRAAKARNAPRAESVPLLAAPAAQAPACLDAPINRARMPVDGFAGEIPPEHLRQSGESRTDSFDRIQENAFVRVAEHPLSTFAVDVDTASYSLARRALNSGRLPIPGVVRVEEMVNYFDYDYAPPADGKPFATHLAAVVCPWNPAHRLVRVGLKGRVLDAKARAPMNLVFLIDVSGSMDEANRLPLVKKSLTLLVQQLRDDDRVALAVYAGSAGLRLPSTPASERKKILAAIDGLEANGSTNGGEGIQLAYATAAANFLKNGNNRVILCSDGDFNIGMTSHSELLDLIEKKAKEKVFLTVLGFGMGNYKDSLMEKLADKGNGNYGYIDTLGEAKKLLVHGLSGTLETIAKDVKIQVEFNPAVVGAYRLLGYENRKLNKEDFNDDKKDAGEIGAGHSVTALYEVVPAEAPDPSAHPAVDPLKYAAAEKVPAAGAGAEMLTVKLRYKEPDEETSKRLEFPLKNDAAAWERTDADTRFAAAVAAFAMKLRHSRYAKDITWAQIRGWAEANRGADPYGYRDECCKLIRMAESLENK